MDLTRLDTTYGLCHFLRTNFSQRCIHTPSPVASTMNALLFRSRTTMPMWSKVDFVILRINPHAMPRPRKRMASPLRQFA